MLRCESQSGLRRSAVGESNKVKRSVFVLEINVVFVSDSSINLEKYILR